jgi:hypothetical protein
MAQRGQWPSAPGSRVARGGARRETNKLLILSKTTIRSAGNRAWHRIRRAAAAVAGALGTGDARAGRAGDLVYQNIKLHPDSKGNEARVVAIDNVRLVVSIRRRLPGDRGRDWRRGHS